MEYVSRLFGLFRRKSEREGLENEDLLGEERRGRLRQIVERSREGYERFGNPYELIYCSLLRREQT